MNAKITTTKPHRYYNDPTDLDAGSYEKFWGDDNCIDRDTRSCLARFFKDAKPLDILIFTLGMSIDANVLIYERMRDELGRKKTDILIVIKQGFNGAFSAIIDSNITTILSAMTLVAIGSGFIRGFAISLIVGLLTSLFTAIIFTKLIIEFLAKTGKLKLYLKN